MTLLGSTKKDADNDQNGENVPKLQSVEVCLVHCDLVKNDYQHSSKVLFSFDPNKQFGQLINISPNSELEQLIQIFLMLKFGDQTSKALEIEDSVNLTLIIG